MNNYQKYRGKCKQLSEEAIAKDPSLTLIRGHYYCPIWNSKEAHWWTIDKDGVINDPSKLQFPSAGLGEYIPFRGFIECANCSKEVEEGEASIDGSYGFCSGRCYGQFVGVFAG